MLWKPSTSNSLWDSRRMPNLPDVPPALTRTSSFEYESSPAGPVQGTAAAKAKAKPTVAQRQSAPSVAAIRGMRHYIVCVFSWKALMISDELLINSFTEYLHPRYEDPDHLSWHPECHS